MEIVYIAIYLLFCLLVSWVGRRANLGFFGVFFLSIFLTPFLVAVFLVLFSPKTKNKG